MKTWIMATILAALGCAGAASAATEPALRVVPAPAHVLRVVAVERDAAGVTVVGEVERRRMSMRSRPFGTVELRAVGADGVVVARAVERVGDGLWPRRGAQRFTVRLALPEGAAPELALVR